jgi:hypothetical protein
VKLTPGTALIACLKSHGVTLPNRGFFGRRPGSGTSGGSATSKAGGAGGGSGTSTTGGTGGPPPGGGRGGFFRRNPKLAAAFKACGANFGFRGGAMFGRLSH